MAIIQSGDNSQNGLLLVDPTSKALRVTPYDNLGRGSLQRATFVGAMTAKAVVTANAGPFMYFYGSPTKTIRVLRVCFSVTLATTAAYLTGAITLQKNRVPLIANTTLTSLSQVPLDSNSGWGSASVCCNITANTGATIGFDGAVIAEQMRFCPVTGTPARLGPRLPLDNGYFDFEFEWGKELSPIVLNGTQQGLDIGFKETPGTNPTVFGFIMWTEE